MGFAWRLLIDGPSDGARNMAVDEALLDRYSGPDVPAGPTLRLYAWNPATLSLGRQQRVESRTDPVALRVEGIGLVRRPTGGRAVLHEHERTYGVVGRLREEPFTGGVLETYRRIAEALVAALRELGVEAEASSSAREVSPHASGHCFQTASAHEILWRGRKIVGSAQLRRRGAFLQHGSVILRANPARWARAAGAPESPGSFPALGVGLEAIDAALVSGFRRELGADLRPGRLTDGEELAATRLRAWKYTSAAWTLEGRIPAPPGRIS